MIERLETNRLDETEYLARLGLKPGDIVEIEWDTSSGSPVKVSQRIVCSEGTAA